MSFGGQGKGLYLIDMLVVKVRPGWYREDGEEERSEVDLEHGRP